MRSLAFIGPTPAGGDDSLSPPSLVVAGSLQASTASLAYNLSSGGLTSILENDVLFGLFESAAEAPPNTPGGWTYLTGYSVGTPGDAAAVGLYSAWLRVGPTAPSNTPSFGDAGDHLIGRALQVRGCRTSGAPVVVLAGSANSQSEPIPIPVANTPSDQCLVVHAIAHGEDTSATFVTSWSSPALTGGTALFATGSSQGNGGGLGAYAGIKEAAGSLGTVTADLQNLTQPLNLARATFAFIPG